MQSSSYDLELYDLDIEVPDWVDGQITVGTVESIYQGGCHSGAYMPSVTYADALRTMAECGDDVISYLHETGWEGELKIDAGTSWAGIACDLLSAAVEIWAGCVWDEVCEAVAEREALAEDCDV
jgi:hypothetical protein